MANYFKTLRIGLSPTGLALMITGRRSLVGPRMTTLLAEVPLDGATFAGAVEALDIALGQLKRLPPAATVILADDWCRMFIVQAPVNSRRLDDLRTGAQARFDRLYGESPEGWCIAADWRADDRFLACAINEAARQRLLAVCRKHGLSVLGVVPQFVAAWNGWRAKRSRDAWFGVVQDDMLTLAVPSGRGVGAIRRLRVPAAAASDGAWLAYQVRCEALRAGSPVPDRIQLCGSVAPAWLSHDGDQDGTGMPVTWLNAQPDAWRVTHAAPAVRLAATGAGRWS